jgi:hypothetical protein
MLTVAHLREDVGGDTSGPTSDHSVYHWHPCRQRPQHLRLLAGVDDRDQKEQKKIKKSKKKTCGCSQALRSKHFSS